MNTRMKWVVRGAVIAGLALSLCSCFDFRGVMVIHNGCYGSWIRVTGGDGRILLERLEYGEEDHVELRRDYGKDETVYLIANGFSLVGGVAIGADETSREVKGGSISSPDVLRPWRITRLHDSDYDWNCYPP